LTPIKAAAPTSRRLCFMTTPIRTAKPRARHTHPYPLPRQLAPDETRILDYWRSLLRGAAAIPFADDLKLTDIPDLKARIFMLDAFERPERFRFALVGSSLAADGLCGTFLDEARLPRPFEFLASQCAATIECGEPTFYRHDVERPYTRLLLPLWAEGRISTLLGALDRA
jgi:hypothetical protein